MLVLVVALGGAVGGVLRWSAGELVPDGDGFPQTIFAVNVVGSFLLALLPASAAVRRHRALAVGLGPGLLGGFTTLSTASEQTRSLLDHGRTGTAGVYLVGSLAATLAAVTLATRLGGAAPASSTDHGGGRG